MLVTGKRSRTNPADGMKKLKLKPNERSILRGSRRNFCTIVNLPVIAASLLLVLAGCSGADSGEASAQSSSSDVLPQVASTTETVSQFDATVTTSIDTTTAPTANIPQEASQNSTVELPLVTDSSPQRPSVSDSSTQTPVADSSQSASTQVPEAVVVSTQENPSTTAADVEAAPDTSNLATSLVARGTDLGTYVPSTPPVPSSAAAPGQPVTRQAVLSESSPAAAPITEFPDGFDSSSNNAPYFENLDTTVVLAGQTMELRIVPRDADGNIPGLFTGPLPEGARFRDNFDGTKSIVWSPLEPDVGVVQLSVTAVDAEAPLYRTTQLVRIHVNLPDDLSSIRNLPPAIDLVRPHRARAGDVINIHVKGTDPNGHAPLLEVLTPRNSSSFELLPEDEQIRVFKWATVPSDVGVHNLRFKVTDARDPNLTAERTISIELSNANAFIRPGPRLRTLAEARDFYIGYAALLDYPSRPDGVLYEDIAVSEFNLWSTENSVKWGTVNPEPNTWRWKSFDNEVAVAHANSVVVHGHPLIWYTQLPQWVQELEIGQREGVMLDYIAHVVGRYGAHIALWDVVNEAFEDDGSFRNSVWFEAMGEGYIAKAFKQAAANSPFSRLIYNDYDVAWEGAKSDAMYRLAEDLLEQGVPLHGVGFQFHVETTFDRFESVERNLQRFADLGLEIYITELDVSETASGQNDLQAEVYSKVLGICLRQPQCKALQSWGFTDRYSWRRDRNPLLFDRNYNAKPSYFALQQRLTVAD